MIRSILPFVGIVLLGVSIPMNAQEKLHSYSMDYFSKDYEIMANEPGPDGDYSFYITAYSVDSSVGLVSLIIEKDKVEDFKNMISEAGKVYRDWKAAAVENQVFDLDKIIKTDRINIQSAFMYGDWSFDFTVGLQARMRIVDGENLLIIENKDKLQATNNEYIESDGFVVVFSSEAEIDDFISKIDPNKAEAFFASKKSKEDIFKQ